MRSGSVLQTAGRALGLVIVALVVTLALPLSAAAENQFWIMGKRDMVTPPGYSATYAGLSFYTWVYDWTTMYNPSNGTAGMHVSSGYMWLDSDSYIEAGAKVSTPAEIWSLCAG